MPEHHSNGSWGTARAPQQGARAGKHCSSGMWGTARAAHREVRVGEQSFSGIGEKAH
jgi:hypothetical protein